ncbi:hypothetical protein [Streptomyces alfalfae]
MRRVLGNVAVTVFAAAAVFMAAGTASADDSTFSVAGPVGKDGAKSVAQCPAGSHLIGGGYRSGPAFTNGGSPADFVDSNGPSTETPNAWEAKLHVYDVRAIALCERDRA